MKGDNKAPILAQSSKREFLLEAAIRELNMFFCGKPT